MELVVQEDSPDATLRALTQNLEAGTGADLDPTVAEACTPLIKAGLPPAKLWELLDKYLTPAKCEIKAPVREKSWCLGHPGA